MKSRLVTLALITTLVASACSSDDDGTEPASSEPQDSVTAGPDDDNIGVEVSTSGGGVLPVRLSAGQSQAEPPPETVVVDGDVVPAVDVVTILGALDPLPVDPDAAQPFNWPTESLTPPRAGDTIDVPFPADTGAVAPEVDSGPLEVLRFQPEGDVAVAPTVSVTFNQPMIPLGTVAQVESIDVPITITPAVDGEWRWLGTRTALFEATVDGIDRLPMATAYTVEIPAGTTSENGGVLAEAVSFTFDTPAPQVISFPSADDTSLALDPVFTAVFDQRIDQQAVLDTISLLADGEPVDIRLATEDEIAADDRALNASSQANEGRWLAFRAEDLLPTDAEVEVAVGPGTPSAEGPLATTEAQVFRSRTYAPLRVVRSSCDFGTECPPGTSFSIELNNSIDSATFDPASVRISPELADLAIGVSGNFLSVRGRTIGSTDYVVTLPAGLTDVFGQQLGEDHDVELSVGRARPSLRQFPLQLITLDPHVDGASLPAVTVNHDELRVRLYRADPDDWSAYVEWQIDRRFDAPVVVPDEFALVRDDVVAISGIEDQGVETSIDLADSLGAETGHLIAVVEVTEDYPANSDDFFNNLPAVTWVQATDLGVDVFADQQRAIVWTTSLTSGEPIPAAEMELVTIPFQSNGGVGPSDTTTATTDRDGLARVDLPTEDIAGFGYTNVVIARFGADSAIVTPGLYGGAWQATSTADEIRWFVFDDRSIYRPGETASVKGWVRRTGLSNLAHPDLVGEGTITWVARDGFYNEVDTGTVELNPLGGFDLTFDIPPGANEGFTSLSLTLDGDVDSFWEHPYQLQSFRRPEYEVTARAETPGPYVSREPVTVAVDANYFAGGPLANAPVTWTVSTTETSYSPPGWDRFHFGVAPLWWEFDYAGELDGRLVNSAFSLREECCFPSPPTEVTTFSGTTDASGSNYLLIEFSEPEGGYPDLPASVTAQAAVTDVNRQTTASTTSALIHPGRYYVGLRSARPFVEQGSDLDIEVVVTDIDGAATSGRAVTVTAERLASVFVDGEWREEAVDTQSCETTSGAEPVVCAFATSAGGRYRISSLAFDDAGGASRTEITVLVSGGDARPARLVEQERLTVIPDRESYQPGDTAVLLVQAPFGGPATGLITVSRGGDASAETFTLDDGSATVEVPIGDDDIPSLGIDIEVVGSAPRIDDAGEPLPDAPQRVAYATSSTRLAVPPTSRTLDVEVTPQPSETTPGADASVTVVVRDSVGEPVPDAEVAVVVVDEAVLALTGYQLASPLTSFYADRSAFLQTLYGRAGIQLIDPDALTPESEQTSGDGADSASDTPEAPAEIAGGEGRVLGPDGESFDLFAESQAAGGGVASTPVVDVRTNFDALALFEPAAATGPDGTTTVPLTLPDSLTRYRVMVVAVSGAEDFGTGEANLTARLPLMVRPSAPRFANFGDRFELPVVVQNQTSAPLETDVVVQTTNLLLDGSDPANGAVGRRVTVPANDRIEVRFPVSTESAGTASVRVIAVSGALTDAAVVSLPVYTPATAEAFATYGVLDGASVAQPLLAPSGVVPQFGGLDISTSSTSLQALTDAVIYLDDYPYDSVDAAASRVLSIAALRPVLEAFDTAGLPSASELDTTVARDLARLGDLQNDDGGFGYWERNGQSNPFTSLLAVHALVEARGADYQVDENVLSRGLEYAANIEAYFPPDWEQDLRDHSTAYALWIRNGAGDRDATRAQELWDRRGDELPLDAVAWLWSVIDDAAVRAEIALLFANRATETAGAANFTQSYSDGAHLIMHSDRRTDGIVLDALIDQDPESDLIPKVVQGLMAARTSGRWQNVQENTFILLALERYFETYEAQDPDFVARVWLGDRYAGAQEFQGRSTDRNQVSIPTADLIAGGDSDIVIEREGTGRLYYRLGLRYAPDDLVLEPLDRGFVVERRYEAVDDPSDVRQDSDGTWRISPGARVRVVVSMVADSARTNMALIDPLPAGLEIENPELAVTQTIIDEPEEGVDPFDSTRYAAWFDHQNRRDDRAEAFAGFLPGGVYEYRYVARATTPGEFVVPPTRAEEIYAPETFGRAGTDRVIVEG